MQQIQFDCFTVFNSGPFEGVQFWQMTVPAQTFYENLDAWAADEKIQVWINSANRKQVVIANAIQNIDVNYVYTMPSELGAAIVLVMLAERRKKR